MNDEQRLFTQDEAATAATLELAVVQWCAASGLIAPPEGYSEPDLAELRRVRRLIEDLGLDFPAIEVVLRMRQRLLSLQAQLQRLEAELRLARRIPAASLWVDAEWTDIL